MNILEETIEGYLQAIIEAYRGRLDQSVNDDIRRALQALKTTFNGMNGIYTATLDIPSTIIFVDEGSRPHFPPPKAIEEWLEVKHIIPRPKRLPRGKTYLPTVKQLSFMIANTIAKRGTKGRHITNDVLADVNREWLPKILNAMNQLAIDTYITKLKSL